MDVKSVTKKRESLSRNLIINKGSRRQMVSDNTSRKGSNKTLAKRPEWTHKEIKKSMFRIKTFERKKKKRRNQKCENNLAGMLHFWEPKIERKETV